MKAVILAGGLGTRLAEETSIRPKPMVEIGGLPILWHIMKFYAAHGIREFVVCAGYKQEVIKEYFFNYHLNQSNVTFDLAAGTLTKHATTGEDWKVTVVDTGAETQTGGRLKRVREFLGNEPFCMTYGDGVSDVDINALVLHHKRSEKLVTLTAVYPPLRFGELEIENGLITHFMEKMASSQRRINGGYMVVDPKALDYVDGDATPWEQAPLQTIAAQGQLAAFEHDGFWQCMDNVRERDYLQALWQSGKAPWKIW